MTLQELARAEVGDQLPIHTFGPVTRATLALYAGASGDHNPIHIDSDYAKQAGVGDCFAHGMLSMAQLGRLVTDRVGVANLRSLSTRFLALTHIGDTVRCSGEVVEIFERDGERRLRLNLIAETEQAKTLAGEAVVAVEDVR